MRKILILQGHPNKDSYCFALGQAYKKGALETGAEVEVVNIVELDFNPNLKYGYNNRTDLEPDLLAAWDKIKWANHVVLVHPLWWGGLPAVTKGFFDRLFLPGMAFQKRENSLFWDKLLKGRSARIITTMDQPPWYYWLNYFAPSHRAVKNMTFRFTGFSPVKITLAGPIRLSKQAFRDKWIMKTQKLGRQLR